MNLHLSKHFLRIDECRELSASNSRTLFDMVRSVLESGSVVEIDLSGVLVMDCSGLGALVSIRNLLRERNGRLCLLNPSGPAQKIFQATRATQLSELVRFDPVVAPHPAGETGPPPSAAQIEAV